MKANHYQTNSYQHSHASYNPWQASFKDVFKRPKSHSYSKVDGHLNKSLVLLLVALSLMFVSFICYCYYSFTNLDNANANPQKHYNLSHQEALSKSNAYDYKVNYQQTLAYTNDNKQSYDSAFTTIKPWLNHTFSNNISARSILASNYAATLTKLNQGYMNEPNERLAFVSNLKHHTSKSLSFDLTNALCHINKLSTSFYNNQANNLLKFYQFDALPSTSNIPMRNIKGSKIASDYLLNLKNLQLNTSDLFDSNFILSSNETWQRQISSSSMRLTI